MDRSKIELEGYLERWLTGRLPLPERRAYETHWFCTDSAFRDLETGVAIRCGFWAGASPDEVPPAA